MQRGVPLLFVVALSMAPVGAQPVAVAAPATTDPLIYSSDLHPRGDADDWYDAAFLYSLDRDVTFVLDNPQDVQSVASGRRAVATLNEITGRDVRTRIGLEAPLRTPNDEARGQRHQAGVRAILRTLRHAEDPVPVVTVGSLRDLAAAYNREPALVSRQVESVVVFAGDASAGATIEANVAADANAFVRVMTKLPVKWVPSFDGGPWVAGTRSSYVQLPQDDLASALPPEYHRLLVPRFEEPVRNLWAGPLIEAALGSPIVSSGTVVADFVSTDVRFALDGTVAVDGSYPARVDLFTVRDRPGFERFMHDELIRGLDRLR